MLKVIRSFRNIPFQKLMTVYAEALQDNGKELYPQLAQEEQLIEAEQDFYNFLRAFFDKDGSIYCIWEENDRFISALRLEPYEDGVLLEALETAADYRRQGYATLLMYAVIEFAKEQGIKKIYSHVHRNNVASIMFHNKTGFVVISNYARYIDGSVSHQCNTFLLLL